MRLDINQKKIALGDKYNVVKDGQILLKAASKLFRFLAEIEIFKPDETRVARIKRKFRWIKAHYAIEIMNQPPVLFQTIRYWKNHYQCTYQGNSYDIYGHRGRKFSIYKNKQQIAWFDKEAVTFFEGDNYKLIIDDNADQLLALCFVLIIDNFRSKGKNDGAVNFDIGNLFQAKAFDDKWLPKTNDPFPIHNE